MKILIKIAVFLLAPSLMAVGQTKVLVSQACGPDSARFSVRMVSSRPSLATPPTSRARVVVFAEDVNGLQGCWLLSRIGVDGHWIGAVCMQSYVSAEIEPGPHRLCADLQQRRGLQHTALYDFTAGSDKVYYFRVEVLGGQFNVHLTALNDAEGRLLLLTRTHSVASQEPVKPKIKEH